jgi:disulfide bond formation protein DsbB
MYLLDTLNFFFALGGLGLLAVTVGLSIDYVVFKSTYYQQYLKPFAWPALLLVTAGSVFISLLYSEYFGFIPCSLCWLQRIAIYPQALFSIIAFRSKEAVFYPLYSIALSILGLGVAVYQYIYQMVPKEVVTSGFMPCLADGSADCASKVIDEFGFVTFPLLSAITFAFLIVVYLNLRRSS